MVNELYRQALLWNPVYAWILFLLAADHLALEALYWICSPFTRKNLATPSERELPRIAIIVPTYREASVIGGMLEGNLGRIDYPKDRYAFSVGLYPNDPDGIEIVRALQRKYPGQVTAVVNRKRGPTSKGQMLNELIRAMKDQAFDGILMHDAEDAIHPGSLAAIARAWPRTPYLQLPVIPYVDGTTTLIGESYADEFLQCHLKELPLRARLGASVPSAGVGTAIRRDLLESLLSQGEVFKGETVTEDYELGIRIGHLGFRQEFLLDQDPSSGEWIATREYFPKRFGAAVRQKTRWTVGIAFQGTALIGWKTGPGRWIENLYLFRDRKAALLSVLSLLGLAYGSALGIASLFLVAPPFRYTLSERLGLALSLAYGLYMACERFRLGTRQFGWRFGLTTFIRWPVATLVNGIATLRALRQFTESAILARKIRWESTDHELPSGFASAAPGTRIRSTVFLASLIIGIAAPGSTRAARDEHCILILSDDRGVQGSALEYSNAATTHLSNLLAHFPEFQQISHSLQDYRAGDLSACPRAIYLGVYPMIELPTDFTRDLMTSATAVFWMGPNADLLPSRLLDSRFGLNYVAIESQAPAERRIRYREMDFATPPPPAPNGWMITHPAPGGGGALVLAAATSPDTTAVLDPIPYVTRKTGSFFVADMPFSYYQADDRSQVVGDVLFDFLGVDPEPGPRKALVRLEDVHPNLPEAVVESAFGFMSQAAIPYLISAIPIFRDPLMAYAGASVTSELRLSQAPEFAQRLVSETRLRASLAMHGVTHQHGETPNGFRGVSGEDFEFWDVASQQPLPEDSSLWLLDRLRAGYRELERVGLQTEVWITPHYASSALDSWVFGQVFDWQVGRVAYATSCKPRSLHPLPALFTFGVGGAASGVGQNLYLGSLTTECSATNVYAGQVFQYPIYGDAYGQRVMPENLDLVAPWIPGWDLELKAGIERRLKLRDAWVSFFVHPHLLSDPELRDRVLGVIRHAKDLGFEFVDVRSYAEKERRKRSPTVRLR